MSLFEIQFYLQKGLLRLTIENYIHQLSHDVQKLHEAAVVLFCFECRGKTKNLRRKKKILIDDELGNCTKRVLSVLCLKFSEIKVLVLVS